MRKRKKDERNKLFVRNKEEETERLYLSTEDRKEEETDELYFEDDLSDDELVKKKLEKVNGITSGDCYRHICKGTMTLESDVCFVCDHCGISVPKELYYMWLIGETDLESGDNYDGVPGYSDVFTEDGDEVFCDWCGIEIKWKDGQYVCPNCGQEMTREIFFNYIGANPPGKECITCDELYPGCMECPHGYLTEE